MTLESTNQDSSALHFYENTRWRFLSNTLWNGLILVMLIIVVLIGSISSEGFLSARNFQNILWIWLTTALLVPTMSLIIATGGLDLSVGAVAAFTAAIIASLASSDGSNIGVAVVVGLGLSLFIGLVNGFLVGVIKFNGVIVTLAMMTALRGINYMLVPSSILVKDAGFLSSPAIPGVLLILLVIVSIVATELKPLGKKTDAQPENKASWVRQSLLIGLPYVFSSLLAGFVGAFYLGRLKAAMPTLGTGLEFDVILMAILGGTPWAAGFVNIIGGVLAAFLITTLQNISTLNGMAVPTMNAAKGLTLLAFGLFCHAYCWIVNLIFARTGRKAVPEAPQEILPEPG